MQANNKSNIMFPKHQEHEDELNIELIAKFNNFNGLFGHNGMAALAKHLDPAVKVKILDTMSKLCHSIYDDNILSFINDEDIHMDDDEDSDDEDEDDSVTINEGD